MKHAIQDALKAAGLPVSVPLRGSGDETLGYILNDHGGQGEFPSPCGEVVMKQSFAENPVMKINIKFPSPCGEVVMKHGNVNTFGRIFSLFPSPCGEVVMKRKFIRRIPHVGMFPSPCGEVVMKHIPQKGEDFSMETLFPSPCGEVVMKPYSAPKEISMVRSSFRPLAGKW